jgi:16S rRNA pseudouridine516 synthase
MRLDKFICKSTDYSLVAALTLIENGTVCVNGILSFSASHQVHQNNVVTLEGGILTLRSFRYLMLNKPADMICSNVDDKYPSVLNLLKIERVTELHIAGRLDADTTGLVLITDDGHWSFNLTLPKNKCEKIYNVLLSKPIAPDATERFQRGLLLHGESELTLPARLKIINPYHVELALTEGRFRQVKRMFFAIGNKVKSLHRRQIGNVELDLNLDLGHWRSLTKTEIAALFVSD